MENHHTVRSFDKELRQLTAYLLTMGQHVNELIALSVISLENHSDDIVKQAKGIYKKISALDTDVDKDATAMLALRQPKAIDLRFVTSAIKISTSLERMGELAKNNVKRANRVDSPIPVQLTEDFKKVAALVQEMLRRVLRALEQGDSQLAAKVWEGDDTVDHAYKALFPKLQDTMIANPASIPSCIQIAFAAKNLEHLGDYITKLAKNVHYIISGKRPKKLKLKEELVS